MTTEFVMPDGTHVRVNDEDADQMPDDWKRLDALTDATGEFVSTSKTEEEEPAPKAAPAPKAQAKTKVVKTS